MEPNDDLRLRRLLSRWKAPETPSSLEQRVLALTPPPPWWRFLLRGYIRVPVPVACCLALLLFFAGLELTRRISPAAPCVAAASAPRTQPVARDLDRCRPAQSCS